MSPLRVLPLPSTCPPPIAADILAGPRVEPFRAGDAPYVQDALALDYSSLDPEDDDRFFEPQPCGCALLPDPRGVAVQLAQALVEVMAGTRPAPQVVRWLSPPVYGVLAHRALVASRRTGTARTRVRTPVVRRVLVDVVADGVAEVTVVVVHPERVRALAMRMAGVDHRWMVTDLVMG